MHTDAETFVFQGTVVAVQKSMSQSDFAFAPARDDVVFAPSGLLDSLSKIVRAVNLTMS